MRVIDSGTDIVYIYDVYPPCVWRGWQVVEEREWDTNGEGAEDVLHGTSGDLGIERSRLIKVYCHEFSHCECKIFSGGG